MDSPFEDSAWEIDEETKRILDERLKTFDEDLKTARPAQEVLAELRAKLKESSRGRKRNGH